MTNCSMAAALHPSSADLSCGGSPASRRATYGAAGASPDAPPDGAPPLKMASSTAASADAANESVWRIAVAAWR